jgi:hypothetical protein
MSPLSAWQDFYVIVGTSAGALTGLTFVVVTLVAALRERSAGGGVAAFGTPTVVHFGSVLFVAALLSAPWQTLAPASLVLVLVGLGGVGYALVVARRVRRQEAYTPVLEDWLWHGVLPVVAYGVLAVSALLLQGRPVQATFGVGAVSVLLLCIGIHNAWDALTYIAIERFQPQEEQREQQD